MIKIGITGGIGSGKTTVCRIMEEVYGIPVYYADDRAKWLMQHQASLVTAIKAAFGEEAYLADGGINRAYLSGAVFGDPEKLAVLNSIVHPAVWEDGEAWMEAQAAKGCRYVLKEAALLVETGSYRLMDKLVVVTAPLAQRISRTMERDRVDEAAVRARISKQLSDEEKIKVADFVIHNDGDIARLREQVQAMLAQWG